MDEQQVNDTLRFPTGKREIRFCVAILLIALLLADFVIMGGFNLGFALACAGCIVCSSLYLRSSKLRGYPLALIILDLVIALSFFRSDDGFVKFIMVCFMLFSGNLSLALLCGQNRRDPGGILSMLDAPRAFFVMGFGGLGGALGGLNDARKNAGEGGKKSMAVIAGLAITLPLLAILIPLLVSADAAFEGLIQLLPKPDVAEPIQVLLFGLPLACVLYARGVALRHGKEAERSAWTPKTASSLTVNTVLIAVNALYLLYLFSQLAYFVGGFSGIIPEGYSVAEYARRGFFEMAWLAFLNLLIMTVSIALSKMDAGLAPRLTRVLCLLIGLMTLFIVSTASFKMLHYIGSYGLTRLRLLTEVIIIFMAISVIFVSVWLFRPKFPYMKAIVITALIMGAAVAWADVDTVVAAYNVTAYQSGRLQTVDMGHLRSLGDGAVPYLHSLAGDANQAIARQAVRELTERSQDQISDIRGWNIATIIADSILEQYR